MIRIRFSSRYPQEAFRSWFKAMDKHGGAVSDLTHDSRGYVYEIKLSKATTY